ncbi:hypothetical protein KSF_099550 [Reticulibacter mediterranei]|uniref:Uncharacterized protein n=1 Tax=Reticulibacter mediterranei TaxID=2778369 RepID=A0A8J3N629_9CHLR|nr:hypothetical protein [Reticulibacter mediterranei]GHO99907.1 hypothetical protein KSF_099550 [Reticulibacter mediterranei]
MANEIYDYYLGTGSGHISITLQFQDSEDVLLELEEDWMGQGKHRYRLSGKHERFSDSYGWLRIHQVKDLSSSTPERERSARLTSQGWS